MFRQFQRLVSLSQDKRAVTQDCLSIPQRESINFGNPEKKRRRPKAIKLDEKAKEVPSSKKNDGCIIRGNIEEELFKWIPRQSSLINIIFYKAINGWHVAWRRHCWRLGQFEEYCQQQKGFLSQTQKLQISKRPRNFRDVLNDDADNYTQLEDEYIDSKGCEVYVDERSGEVSVRFRGEVKAVVKENGLYAPGTGEKLQCGFFEFEDDEKFGLWSAYVLADAAELKQAQLQSLIRSQSQNVTFKSQKQPIEGIEPLNNIVAAKHKRDRSMQQYSKFNSLQDQKVAHDLVSSFKGVLKKDASKVDMLHYTLEPFAREKLFDEISWEGVNVIFPMPEVGPLLPEEKAGYARRALESSAAVVQGMAGLIHKVAQGDTENQVGKMFKIFEASVLYVSDAQVERELRLEGVYQGPQTEDVLSQKTKERFQRKSAKLEIDGRRDFSNIFRRTAIYIISRPGAILHADEGEQTFNAHQNSTQQPISSKFGEQKEAMCQERNSSDPAEDLNKAVCWEHVSFDPAKVIERVGCGDQGSTDLAAGCADQGFTDLAINQGETAGCKDQGSTNLAINQDGLAECGVQGSTDFADQLESNQYQQKKQPDEGKQGETESLIQQNTSKLATQYGKAYQKVSILSRS
ncbi:MAG: hypothetical protein EZS28_007238 [Streblomastix strix]|uniref:Uncharacterized protein n=1 Tax=Streblomastix strix TaxID=222440 RepID=A0A5J4WQL0_9EUKA|nr:MAG: hypothetical protein EZS28_007238 [Streblomastix strix]